jgi:hypothetical protein
LHRRIPDRDVRDERRGDVRDWDTVTWHVGAEPEHAPLQPENADSGPACAAKVTVEPPMKLCEQSDGQSIPVPVTEPEPAPASVTTAVRRGRRILAHARRTQEVTTCCST